MTPTPNAVERCKACTDRYLTPPVGFGHDGPSACDLWEAFDTLLADNARLRDVARAAEEAVDNGGHQEQCDWFLYGQTKPCDCGYSALRDAVNAARSSGARGGGE